jgi:hypothetical protein
MVGYGGRKMDFGWRIEVDSMRIPHVVHLSLLFKPFTKCATMLTLMISPTKYTSQKRDLNYIQMRQMLTFLREDLKL